MPSVGKSRISRHLRRLATRAGEKGGLGLSEYRIAPLLLAFFAMAVAALAIGPFLYRSMLPATVGAPPASCSFVAVTTGLFVLLVGATIWLVRRRRRPRDADPDRRLREAVLGEDEQGRRPDGR